MKRTIMLFLIKKNVIQNILYLHAKKYNLGYRYLEMVKGKHDSLVSLSKIMHYVTLDDYLGKGKKKCNQGKFYE